MFSQCPQGVTYELARPSEKYPVEIVPCQCRGTVHRDPRAALSPAEVALQSSPQNAQQPGPPMLM